MPTRCNSTRTLLLAAACAVAMTVTFYLLAERPAPRAPQVIMVQDVAGLIRPEHRDFVARYHAYLRQDHGIDYRVETLVDGGDLDAYAARRFAALDIGGGEGGGRGLLLVIDAAQDLVRLEVGYNLEAVFPDAFVAYLEERQMVPFFRRGRVSDGVVATTELLVTRIQNARANAGFDNEVWLAGSGGGGAQTRARLGQEPSGAPPDPVDVAAEGTPGETLEAYLDTMRRRNSNPALDIYSAATRAMLADWVITPAQMDNVVRVYRSCAAESIRYNHATGRAVIRYPIAERACAPWFFTYEETRWRLDLTMMQRALRFGRSNAWRLVPGVDHPYQFAFEDWDFDVNGFPSAN